MAAAESKRARQQEQKNRTEVEEENRRRENLFNLRYHQDMTDRTEVQGMLRQLREQQDAQRSQNEAKSAVMGDTKEQQVAEQNDLNKAYADSVAGIASNASALKDGYLNQYENNIQNYYQNRRDINSRMSQIHQNMSNQWSQAGNTAMMSAATAAGVAAGIAEKNDITPSSLFKLPAGWYRDASGNPRMSDTLMRTMEEPIITIAPDWRATYHK